MPSPFPGMDPFIEMQEWQDFHTTYMTVIREQLQPLVSPRYVVRVERRVYLEQPYEDPDQFVSDVAILARSTYSDDYLVDGEGQTATAVAPVECLLPEPQEQREYYLVFRERETQRVVTLIELLSPTNKRNGSQGREEYLKKRGEILQSPANLVELDLLRGGGRLPLRWMPPADYYAFVCRAWRRPRVHAYPWTIRQAMPKIPIPLQQGDDEPTLDLQAAFETTYERAAYGDSLDYSQEIKPAINDEDESWLGNLLNQ